MSNPVTYNEFFKGFVLRKKQELVNPRFFGIGEIILPRNSLIHFLPKNPTDYGPSNSEAFIHNFPKEVYIDFSTDLPEFLMGNGRMDTFEVKKAIQAYRAKHYQYNWTRDISTVYNKENVLIVKNYGLVPHRVIYRPSIYMNYEKYYNLQSLIFDNVNKEAAKGKRKQYMRIELPLNMPSFTALSDDYRKFISSFKNGLPVLTPQIVSSTKAENSYWLLDMLAFLVGQYEFSLFNKISPEALEDFHIIFTFQSKALVVKLGLLKEWLDSAGPREIKEYKTAREAFEAVKPTPRMNAVKRFYLALMGLSRNFTPEQEIIKEETNAREEKDSNSSFDTEVAGGEESEQTKSSGRNNAKEKGVPGKNAPANTSPVPSSVADVFSSAETDNGQPDEAEGGEAEGGNSESVEEWTSQVDETLLEVEQVTAEVNTDRDPFSTPEAGIKAALDERARDGVLTVAEQEFFMIKGTRFKNIEMENGQTLEEFIHVDPKELEDLDGKIKGKFLTVLDESVLRSRSTALKIEYSDKFLKKDIAKMFLGVQNAGLALNDYRPENHTSVEGSYDVYNVQLHDVNGEQTTIRPRLPRVDPDGTFIVDGVKQHMQIQRREKPFRKISPTKVALTTYYDRKLMIQRSEKVVDNLGTWMVKQITLQSKEKGYTFSKGGSYDRELDSPRIYSLLSKQYKFIDVDGYRLDFQFKDILAKHPEFKKYLKRDLFLIGVKDGLPLTIDDFGNLYKDGQAFGTIEDLLGVNLRKAPLEHAVVNISGFLFPLGVVLCFYFGITKLLKVIKATTRTVPIGTRPKLANDEYAIQFNDQYLILNRREKLTTLIFGGMPKLNNIGNFSMTDLNNKSIWPSLMGDPRVRPSQFQEMKNLYDLFIDPISKEELRKMGLSESFHYLLIDAAKALETDFSRHEVEIEEQRLVGYERFAGHIYTELVRSIRQYRNKGKGRKHKLDFNPDAVIINIGKDTSVQQVEEVNPIHQIKDQEELTFGGDGGRSQITMVKRARVQLESYKGIVSEANKDSGNVGYVAYATSDPGVADFRGNIDVKNIPSYTGLGSITMNLMYGGTHDD